MKKIILTISLLFLVNDAIAYSVSYSEFGGQLEGYKAFAASHLNQNMGKFDCSKETMELLIREILQTQSGSLEKTTYHPSNIWQHLIFESPTEKPGIMQIYKLRLSKKKDKDNQDRIWHISKSVSQKVVDGNGKTIEYIEQVQGTREIIICDIPSPL